MNNMNESELKSLWQDYDNKVSRIIEINMKHLRSTQTEKAESRIRSFVRGHVAAMLVGIAWIAFLTFLVVQVGMINFFTVSAGAIVVFNVFAVLAYLRHIGILTELDLSQSVTQAQQTLARVQTSYGLVGRILILQTPFYCTWWYTDELLRSGGALFWGIQFILVGVFVGLSVYLFVKLSPRSQSQKWVRWADKYLGSEKIQKASAFLSEIDEYRKE